MTTPINVITEAIAAERRRQDELYGNDHAQSLPGFILLLREQVKQLEFGWYRDLPGHSAPMNQIVQIAALCFAAMEQYGTSGNGICDPQQDSPVDLTNPSA